MQKFYDKYLASKKRGVEEVLSVKKESAKRSKRDVVEDTFEEMLDHVPVMPTTALNQEEVKVEE